MSLHRRAARRDPNEWAIICALRHHGCKVWQLNDKAIPDLLVMVKGAPGRFVLLEVKSPPGPRGGDSGKGQKLNEAQADFFAEAYLMQVPAHVVRDVDEALVAAGVRL